MIDKLKLAIDKKDWSLVIEFYKQLTGINPDGHEMVPVPSKPQKVAETVRKNDLQDFTMRPVQTNLKKATKVEKAEKVVTPKKPKRGGKKTPVKAKQIEFVDTGEAPDEPGADQINDNVALTPRNRKPFKPVTMECILCKSKETVAPLFKRDKDTYKCNSCLSKGKINGPE
jgi:hypothetical protein